MRVADPLGTACSPLRSGIARRSLPWMSVFAIVPGAELRAHPQCSGIAGPPRVVASSSPAPAHTPCSCQVQLGPPLPLSASQVGEPSDLTAPRPPCCSALDLRPPASPRTLNTATTLHLSTQSPPPRHPTLPQRGTLWGAPIPCVACTKPSWLPGQLHHTPGKSHSEGHPNRIAVRKGELSGSFMTFGGA